MNMLFETKKDKTDIDIVSEKWNVEYGDLWEIGDHRIMCGDNSIPYLFKELISELKFDLVITSPPYNDQREYLKEIDNWTDLMISCFWNINYNISENGNIFVILGLSHKDGRVFQYWDKWIKFMDEINWPLFGWYVWDKGSGNPAIWKERLNSSHEFIFHFCKNPKEPNRWIPTIPNGTVHGTKRSKDGRLTKRETKPLPHNFRAPDSVIRTGRENRRGIHSLHPAIYPPELPEILIKTWMNKDSVIYDPFLGSGTTIIAAQSLDIPCLGMEISPEYVAVALQRLSNIHLRPEKINSKPFISI